MIEEEARGASTVPKAVAGGSREAKSGLGTFSPIIPFPDALVLKREREWEGGEGVV